MIHKSLVDIVINPIRKYLMDNTVQEVMVNHSGVVIIEQGNHLSETDQVLSRGEIETIIRVIASRSGIVVNPDNPSFSSQIEGVNCRFHGMLPPATASPIFCIRKLKQEHLSLEYLNKQGMLTIKQTIKIKQAIVEKKNILIAGATGSGKTTLANAILQKIISMGDRVIVIEDTPELLISERNGVRLLVGENYNYTKAIFDVLRMRPDRIVLGELRDGAALDLLKAWNTGHKGGVATIHANSASLAMVRLIQLIEEVSANPPYDFIAEEIDMCIFVSRHKSKRKIKTITEIHGYNHSTKKFIFEELV